MRKSWHELRAKEKGWAFTDYAFDEIYDAHLGVIFEYNGDLRNA